MFCSTRFEKYQLALFGFLFFIGSTNAEIPPRAGVFADELPGASPALARELAAAAADAGYQTEFIDRTALASKDSLKREKYALLVLPGARSLPLSTGRAIEAYLRQGGSVLAAGLPAWEAPMFSINGKWISRQAYEEAIAAQKSSEALFDTQAKNLSQWTRNSYEPGSKTDIEAVPGDKGQALHVTIHNLTGWDTLSAPKLQRPLPAGHVLTCFRAKGDGATPRLAIEWTEGDGERWIATVDLASDWKDYVLTPEAFQHWPSPGPVGRHLEMSKAARFTVGLAMTHTPMLEGKHSYWIEEIGSAPHPFGNERMDDAKAPLIETFSPPYLFYSVTGPVTLSTPADLGLATPAKAQASRKEELLAMHPRARSIGFEQGRAWRWQPLLEARARNGDYRGAIGSLALNFAGDFRGGSWACFTPADLKFYQQPEIKRLLRETISQMRRGLFLREGGSEFFTVFDDQTFRLGAKAANLGCDFQENLVVRLTVKGSKHGETCFSREWPFDLKAGEEKNFEQLWRPQAWAEGGFIVTTELARGDGRSSGKQAKVIDRLSHELNVWRPKAKPEFIEAHDGQFWLKGKPWKAHGVNYMPSSGVGLRGEYFEFWVGRGAYDPEVIERDLRRIKVMGLNAISVFIYHGSLDSQHLLDLLRRCETLGLHVNQSLRPGTPMNFLWPQMKELIEFYRLAQNDTVFAYDLAWEPAHHDLQRVYGAEWASWVEKKFGNRAEAQKRWGIALPKPEGAVPADALPVPTMRQLTQDGEWRTYVIDFRCFLDEQLAGHYAEARRLVKSVDPHHAVSLRMSLAGDPTANVDDVVPYDFFGLANAVDIFEPEAYGRIGNWERVKPGRFTSDYARLCDPGKPLVWAEMGFTVWDKQNMTQNPETLQFMAGYTSDFYRMMAQAGASGIFFWWYPGGYRVGEDSDFGIINPDGTDRPMTKVIRREGRRFLAAGRPPQPDYFVSVTRNRDARGLFGLYRAAQAEYWKAIEQGKTPGLEWKERPEGR